MSHLRHRAFLTTNLFLAFGLLLAGCATTRPVAYANLASSARLEPNPGSDANKVPYLYSDDADWGSYTRVLIEPVQVYRGPDSQFEKISESDQRLLARYLETRVRETLRSRYSLVTTPAPGTLRLRLTLTGAKTTAKVIGTVLRFDLAGGSYNLVQSARGREGAMTGSVSYAVEISDATTGRLLRAYVTKQYPNAMNVAATLGGLDAAKVGIDKGVEDLIAHLN